jgi:glutamate synthase domain-containing protein 3
MVKLEEVKEEDKETLYNLLRNHYKYTQSRKAKKIIESISDELRKFVKVIPIEYKRILEGIKIEEKLDLKEAYDG